MGNSSLKLEMGGYVFSSQNVVVAVIITMEFLGKEVVTEQG